jgi:hypothetical protein
MPKPLSFLSFIKTKTQPAKSGTVFAIYPVVPAAQNPNTGIAGGGVLMKLKFIVFAIAVCLIAFPAISGATPVLKISSGATNITIADESAHDSVDASSGFPDYLGVIGYNGVINGWQIHLTADATIGSMIEPIFDVNGVVKTTSRTAPEDLVIMFSDSGFSGLDIMRTFEETIGGTLAYSGALTARAYYGVGLFDTSNEITNLQFSSPYYPSTGFNGTDEISGLPSTNFSMTQVIVISHPAATNSFKPTTSFDAMLSDQIPEPSTLILLGSGLIGAGLFFRRKVAN